MIISTIVATQPTTNASMADVPNDVLGRIGSFLGRRDLSRMALTNKAFHGATLQHRTLLFLKDVSQLDNKSFLQWALEGENGQKIRGIEVNLDRSLNNSDNLRKFMNFLAQRPRIVAVRIRNCTLQLQDIQAMLPYFNQAKELSIRYADIDAAGAQAIAESTTLGNLTKLNLGGNQIGDAGAQAIADSTTLGNLTMLNLSDARIGAAGAQAIAESTTLGNLTALDLTYNRIGNAGAQAIARKSDDVIS